MTPQERADFIEEREGPKLRDLVARAARTAAALTPFPQKAALFIELADAIGAAITPHTPCAGGCSHCCHMATAISGFEAAMIGRYIGRKPIAQARQELIDLDMQAKLLEQFTGVPCTFLEAGRCTIYPVRPIACRVHHSVNDTSDACYIDPSNPTPIPVPRVNLTAFINVQAWAFLPDDFGDIREFFPRGEI